MRYSPSLKLCYPEDLSYATLPGDLITISAAQYQTMQAGLAQGKIIVNGAGGVPEAVDPPLPDPAVVLAAWQATATLTDIQFALVASSPAFGLMTTQEAADWVGAGVIPAVAQTAIASIPDAVLRGQATIRFRGARTIGRLDPFVTLLAGVAGLTEAQVDAFFRAGAAL